MPTLEIIKTKSHRVVLRGARVLDVAGGQLLAESKVEIVNGRIRSIDARSSTRNAHVIEGNGYTLMPGLIDCHAHVLSPFLAKQDGSEFAPWVLRQIGRNLKTTLSTGVVAVRDMLSPIHVMNFTRALIKNGLLHGPRIIASGGVLSCASGYPEFMAPIKPAAALIAGQAKYELNSPAQAAAAVRELRLFGADLIKVGYSSRNRENSAPDTVPTMSFEVLDAICRTAHSLGLVVSAHHDWGEDIGRILRCNVDTLEHVICDRLISDEEVELIVKKGIKMVPTVTAVHDTAFFHKKEAFHKSRAARELFEPNILKQLHFMSRTWMDKNEMSYHDVFGYWRGNPEAYRLTMESTRKLFEAGVPLLAGTDCGNVVVYANELAEEIHRLTLIGMPNIDAIRSATIRAAELLGISRDMGEVAPGKGANFILVDGNPLDDITALKRVRLVAKDGRWYRPGGDTATPLWAEDHEMQ